MRTKTADELRQLRKKAGLTVKKACELTDTPVRTWENWEASPDAVSSSKPPGIVFSFLNCYIKTVKESQPPEE